MRGFFSGMSLSKVVLSPACSVQELVLHLVDKHPSLAKCPKRRPWATLDCIEVFGQSTSFREGFHSRESRCAAFDIRLDAMFNVHTNKGLRLLAEMAAQVKVGGLGWISPTCSTWIWLNRGTNCRGVELHGRGDLKSVVAANRCAECIGRVLIPLFIWLGLCIMIEQPQSSLLWKWDRIAEWLDGLLAEGKLWDIRICLSAFGGMSKKPLQLRGNWPGAEWVLEIFKRLQPAFQDRPLIKLTQPVGKWTGGNPFTAVSALYPPTFGKVVAFSHERYVGLEMNTHNESTNNLVGFVTGILAQGYPPAQQLKEEAEAYIKIHGTNIDGDPGWDGIEECLAPKMKQTEVREILRAKRERVAREEAKKKDAKVAKTMKKDKKQKPMVKARQLTATTHDGEGFPGSPSGLASSSAEHHHEIPRTTGSKTASKQTTILSFWPRGVLKSSNAGATIVLDN